MITFTPNAVTKIRSLEQEMASDGQHLRLFVKAGGCSGLEYGMGFSEPSEKDSVLENAGVTFVIDPKSLERLDGSEIHFDDGLNGKGFEIRNPNAQSTCGCGKSFN